MNSTFVNIMENVKIFDSIIFLAISGWFVFNMTNMHRKLAITMAINVIVFAIVWAICFYYHL